MIDRGGEEDLEEERVVAMGTGTSGMMEYT